MPCYSPLKGFRSRELTRNGKRGVVFSAQAGFVDLVVEVPCGQCIGCKLEDSRQWAVRCLHESSLYDRNCYLTLTYNDQFLPQDGGLRHRDFQLFMKRFRRWVFSKYGRKIRFLMCGEYGDQFGRPHYHVIVFNFDFQDRVFWKTGASGFPYYLSADLTALWVAGKKDERGPEGASLGFSSVGDVTFESAAYVARYVTKKVTGEKADEHYTRCDPSTGEFFRIAPEYRRMSRRPGLGKPWLDKFASDVYPSGEVIVRGRPMCPPKFYDNKLKELANLSLVTGSFELPMAHEEYRMRRREKGHANRANATPDRLRVREKIARAKLSMKKRGLE